MKINGDGFLSKQGQQYSHAIISKNSGVFKCLENSIQDLRCFASSQEISEQESDDGKKKIVALLLSIRLLEISEAALLIMKNGMSNEANSLLRIFLDAYFVFANVCEDKSFISNYFKSDNAARLKLMNSTVKHKSELFEKINEYASESLRDNLKKNNSEEKIQEFNSYNYASNVGCSEIYDSLFRLLSANIHTTPRALGKYVDEDQHGNIIEIKDYPIEDNIPQRAYDFSTFLIKVLSGLTEVFGCYDKQEIENKINELNQNYET